MLYLSSEIMDLINISEFDPSFKPTMPSYYMRDVLDQTISTMAETHRKIREQLPKGPNYSMRSEAKRLRNLLDLKNLSSWSPQEMAFAGFFRTGVDISCQCFCCGLVLCKQSLYASPIDNHRKFNPFCGFIRGDDVGNISKYEVRLQPVQVSLRDHNELMKNEQTRLQSFTCWPVYALVEPYVLAQAGFFFTGTRDTVQCFSCAGCLGNWEENDDPWREHAKWFPEWCEFLRIKKSKDDIQQYIKNYSRFEGITSASFTSIPASQEVPVPGMTSLNIFEDENVRLESFKRWPPDANVQPDGLARAGLFYTDHSSNLFLCSLLKKEKKLFMMKTLVDVPELLETIRLILQTDDDPEPATTSNKPDRFRRQKVTKLVLPHSDHLVDIRQESWENPENKFTPHKKMLAPGSRVEYCDESKGYRLWDVTSKYLLKSRDVVLYETAPLTGAVKQQENVSLDVQAAESESESESGKTDKSGNGSSMRSNKGVLAKKYNFDSAFLNGELVEEIYMEPPEHYDIDIFQTRKVCLLKKSLYGLKQSGHCWYVKLDAALLEINFVRSETDHCLHHKTIKEKLFIIAVYVDDLLLGGQEDHITDVKHQLKQRFKLKDLDPVNHQLGLNVHNEDWSDKATELRRCLMDLYNDSNFKKLAPFLDSSHVSVDLSSLFADISVALKDTRNHIVRQLTLPDILSELRDITMIEGEAGSGKTALLRKIAILWASGRCPVLSRFSIVFYISLSYTESQHSLSDIICQQLMGSTTSLTEETLGDIIKQLKNQVLFLLDDYGLMDSTPGSIEELLLKNPWNRLSLAVTVRTDKGRKLRQHARNILSIQAFPLYSSIYIFRQLLSHNVSFIERFFVDLSVSNTFQAALKTPLFTFSLCVFWVQDPNEEIAGETAICKSYLKHSMLKHTTETERIKSVLTTCGELALRGIFQSHFAFTQKDLDESGVNTTDALQCGMLSMFTSQRLHPIFKFFHQSFQEFLAGSRMHELLQSGDGAENERGLSYLQKMNTLLKVFGRYNCFLKNSCMHSPETTKMIISHLFSLLDSSEAFDCQRETELYLEHHPELESLEEVLTLMITDNSGFHYVYVVNVLLKFAINIANESKYMTSCAPIILQFLKGKNVSLSLQWPQIWLLKFLHSYPEGLLLIQSLEIVVPHIQQDSSLDVWNTESFPAVSNVPTVDIDYSNAFQLISDTLGKIPKFKDANMKITDLSMFFNQYMHRISVLRIKCRGRPVENENILLNVMAFCSLSIHIELDLMNCPGFLNSISKCFDQYKESIVKFSMYSAELTREEQELITHLTSLQSLQITVKPLPELLLLNIHHLKELKEIVLYCSDGEWDLIENFPDEFKSLNRIERLVFTNVNMKGQTSRLAEFIEQFSNLISFTLKCRWFPEFEKLITSLCRNGKMQEICFPEFALCDKEIILLALALPSLKNLRVLEFSFDYSAKVESMQIFVEALPSLKLLEEICLPGGDAVRETVTCFIQQFQYMPNLRKLIINYRLLSDSSVLVLAKVCADGHLRNLQNLNLDNNLNITQTGWRDFFQVVDNLPKLKELIISRVYSHQFKTDPVTLIALVQCVSRLHSLNKLVMFGWLLDDKDIEVFNAMKLKHPQAKSLRLMWQWILPFPPIVTE
ncbi:baculoviral IAP repeat-containing protein 1f-like [Pseudophryne corroboree]|uniref:baculoviral IAP repeat-containing protein 1f-like n=1 Tax=Pseudophryne corroboree TaxID=495146 RepID=UPI0030819CFE